MILMNIYQMFLHELLEVWITFIPLFPHKFNMRKCLIYKNLVLTTEGIMFDTGQFKIFELDEEHIQEFENVYRGIINEKDSFISSLIKNRTINYDLKTVKINMTNFCNLKCNYCFANEGTYNKKKRKFDKELIDKFKTLPFLEANLF